MADDAAPLPYPDLRLTQYAFQLQDPELSEHHASASKSFWEGIEKDEMAPYLLLLPSSLTPPSPTLLKDLQDKNEKELERLDKKIEEAEASMGETDVSEVLREKAAYLCRIGDKAKAVQAIKIAEEKTAGLGARIDLVMSEIRLGFFYGDNGLVEGNIAKANGLIDKGGDWDRRNRLKVYRALYHLTLRQFSEASELLIESLSTFTAGELMEYEEFVSLCMVVSGVGCDRKAIKTKILASAEVNALLPQMPALTTFTKSLYDCNYEDFFTSLAEVETQYLLPIPFLAPHARFYVREMRIKAYAQILESYRSLTLERMGKAFGVSPAFIDRDLSRFIASGRLSCTIDKVAGVITTSKASSENKTAAYEQVVKQGDVLLNEIQKLSRVIG